MAEEELTVPTALTFGIVGGIGIASLFGAALPATLVTVGVTTGVLMTAMGVEKVYKKVHKVVQRIRGRS